MGLADRLRGWLGRSQSVSGYPRSDMFGVSARTVTGVAITEETAQRHVAVFAAINLISGAVATTPLHLYLRDGDEKGERAYDHPLHDVLYRRANPEMDALTFRELLTSHLCAWGNGYAEVMRDGQGRVQELWPLRPDRMAVIANARGRTYVYTLPGGDRVPMLPKDVLHLRLRGDHLVGWSPIKMARESIGVALAAEEFAGRFYANGATPSTVLRHPARLSKEAHETLKADWADQHQGLSNAHRAAILEEGMDVKTLGIPPEDAQFLETRQFQKAEVATLYAIPPHMLGDVERSTSWGTGIEQQQLGFQTFTLLPYYSRWEMAANTQLLDPSEASRYLAAHVIENLLRADTQTRFAAYNSAVTTGWMSRAEVRRRENLPPGPPELEQFLTPVAVAQEKPAAPAEPRSITIDSVRVEDAALATLHRRQDAALAELRDGVAGDIGTATVDMAGAVEALRSEVASRVDAFTASVNARVEAVTGRLDDMQRVVPITRDVERDDQGRIVRVVEHKGDRTVHRFIDRSADGSILRVKDVPA